MIVELTGTEVSQAVVNDLTREGKLPDNVTWRATFAIENGRLTFTLTEENKSGDGKQ